MAAQGAQVAPGLAQVTPPHVLQAPGHDPPEGGAQVPRPGPHQLLQREHLELGHQDRLHCGLEICGQAAVTDVPEINGESEKLRVTTDHLTIQHEYKTKINL